MNCGFQYYYFEMGVRTFLPWISTFATSQVFCLSTNGEYRFLSTPHSHGNEIGTILFPRKTEQCELVTRIQTYKCVCWRWFRQCIRTAPGFLMVCNVLCYFTFFYGHHEFGTCTFAKVWLCERWWSLDDDLWSVQNRGLINTSLLRSNHRLLVFFDLCFCDSLLMNVGVQFSFITDVNMMVILSYWMNLLKRLLNLATLHWWNEISLDELLYL